MDDAIELAFQDARRNRAEGRSEVAEQSYRRAAELARSSGNRAALAHALRHMSDLARERGISVDAWQYASEAAELYRKSDDRLGFANALRLQALSAPDPQQARSCWREARDLYSSLEVIAGVNECDLHLHD